MQLFVILVPNVIKNIYIYIYITLEHFYPCFPFWSLMFCSKTVTEVSLVKNIIIKLLINIIKLFKKDENGDGDGRAW